MDWARLELRRCKECEADIEDAIGLFAARLTRDQCQRLPRCGFDAPVIPAYIKKALLRDRIDRHRARQRLKNQPVLPWGDLEGFEGEADPTVADPSPSLEEEILREETLLQVTRGIADLSQTNRFILLRWAQGWTPKQLAERLGMKANTMNQRLHWIRHHLRKGLDDLE